MESAESEVYTRCPLVERSFCCWLYGLATSNLVPRERSVYGPDLIWVGCSGRGLGWVLCGFGWVLYPLGILDGYGLYPLGIDTSTSGGDTRLAMLDTILQTYTQQP